MKPINAYEEIIKLKERTKMLIEDSQLSTMQISQGAGVGYEWTKKFKADAFDNPNPKWMQDLHDFLQKNK